MTPILLDPKKLDVTIIGGGAKREKEYADTYAPFVTLRPKYRGVGGYTKFGRNDNGRSGKATKKKNGITEHPETVTVLVLRGNKRRWERRPAA